MPAVGDKKSGSPSLREEESRCPRGECHPHQIILKLMINIYGSVLLHRKTYLDHCAQSYNCAVDYGFKGGPGRAWRRHIVWPSHFHNGSLISLLLPLPFPPLPLIIGGGPRGPLTRLPETASTDRSHPFPLLCSLKSQATAR